MNLDNLVSVIMPAFNAEHTILGSINSVINQTYGNFEIIVVDDGSTDGTVSVVNAIEDTRIILVRTGFVGNGPAFARNLGIDCASGSFVAFLDSDDEWLANKLEIQLRLMLESKALFSYTSYTRMDHDMSVVLGEVAIDRSFTYLDLLKSCDIGCLTVMVSSSLLQSFKFRDIEKVPMGREDWVLRLEITRDIKQEHVLAIPDSLACYRVLSSSLSGNKLSSAVKQFAVYRTFLQFSLPKCLYFMCHYSMRNLVKRILF